MDWVKIPRTQLKKPIGFIDMPTWHQAEQELIECKEKWFGTNFHVTPTSTEIDKICNLDEYHKIDPSQTTYKNLFNKQCYGSESEL